MRKHVLCAINTHICICMTEFACLVSSDLGGVCLILWVFSGDIVEVAGETVQTAVSKIVVSLFVAEHKDIYVNAYIHVYMYVWFQYHHASQYFQFVAS